jgi:hypothetical protein
MSVTLGSTYNYYPFYVANLTNTGAANGAYRAWINFTTTVAGTMRMRARVSVSGAGMGDYNVCYGSVDVYSSFSGSEWLVNTSSTTPYAVTYSGLDTNFTTTGFSNINAYFATNVPGSAPLVHSEPFVATDISCYINITPPQWMDSNKGDLIDFTIPVTASGNYVFMINFLTAGETVNVDVCTSGLMAGTISFTPNGSQFALPGMLVAGGSSTSGTVDVNLKSVNGTAVPTANVPVVLNALPSTSLTTSLPVTAASTIGVNLQQVNNSNITNVPVVLNALPSMALTTSVPINSATDLSVNLDKVGGSVIGSNVPVILNALPAVNLSTSIPISAASILGVNLQQIDSVTIGQNIPCNITQVNSVPITTSYLPTSTTTTIGSVNITGINGQPPSYANPLFVASV